MVKNILTILTGSSLATLIPILCSPILTRLYTPAEFGAGELYIIGSALLAIFATLRLEASLVLPENENEAKDIFTVIFFTSICICILLYIPIFLLDFLLNLQNLNIYYLLPISACSISIYETSIYYNLRHKKYKSIGLYKCIYFSLLVGLKILFGYLGYSTWGIILGTCLGQLSGCLIVFFFCMKKYDFLTSINLSTFKEIIIRYSEFPKYNLPNTFFNLGKDHSYSFLILKIWSSTILGFYSLTLKILKSPIYLIGNSIGDVLYKKVVHDSQSNSLNLNKLLKFILIFSVLLLFVFILGAGLSPIIITYIFGKNWNETAIYVQLLSPLFYFTLIFISIEKLSIVLKKQKEIFKLNISFEIISILSFFVVSQTFHNVYYSILCLTIVGSVAKIVSITYILNNLISNFSSQKKHL